MTPQEFALIVAGGKGKRFGSTIPKQFMELKGKPILIHTLEAFLRYSQSIRIILVLPADEIAAWKELAQKHNFPGNVDVQPGGATRFQSVKKGLQRITGEGYVAIHDGARPLVTTEIIANSFSLAKIHGTAVAAVALKESLRLMTSADASQAVDRSQYRLVQTPQTFEVSLIRKAYAIEEDESLTDDASVAGKAGFPIMLFDGDYRNLKITTQEDLAVAEALLINGSLL